MAYVESKIPVELSKSHVDITYLISFKCNLQCVYCYQAHDGEYEVLGAPDAKSIATKLLNLHLDDADRFVGNFFGGEPTLFPDFLKEIAEWMRNWGIKNGKRIALSITTNAMFAPSVLPVIWDVADRVKVSFDGIRTVQDYHLRTRSGDSSYDRVLANIDRMTAEHPERVTFRLTVTGFSVPRMAETASFLCQRYPGVPQQYEPAMDSCHAAKGVSDFSMRSFVDSFLEAYKVGIAHNTPVGTFFARLSRFNSDINRFCGVSSMKYTILPDGTLASCNRVHPSTVRETPFYLGAINEITSRPRPEFRLPATCESCYARFACKGGCYALRHSLKIGRDEGFSFCDEIRRLLRQLLVLQLDQKEVVTNAPESSDCA